MKLQFFVKGMRPKTLVAAIVPPFGAYTLYKYNYGFQNWEYLLLCIFLALFIQIATNFYNDAIDYVKGADENRVGPERITTQDKINPKKVFFVGHIFILFAFIVGIPLVLKGGTLFLIVGIVSLFMAYGYTGGPFPLAYLGLGELFVFLFFGLVATSGSFYLFSGTLTLEAIILSSQIGLLSCVLIAINNYRDRATDVLVNKRTLATRMSDKMYLTMIDFFLFFPYVLILYFVFNVNINFFLNLFSVPLAYKVRHIIREKEDLNIALASSGKHLLIFVVLFSMVALWK